jgi:hypothetical protein
MNPVAPVRDAMRFAVAEGLRNTSPLPRTGEAAMKPAIPGKLIGHLSSEAPLTSRLRSGWLGKDRPSWHRCLFLLALVCGPALCDTLADELAKASVTYRAGDCPAAIALYRSLAEKGSAEAQTALAKMHREGKGTAKNDAQAVSWFRRAADQGHADNYQREADIIRAENLVAWARVIEAYHAKSGRYPLQSRVKAEELLRVRIATREQQAFIDSTSSNYDRTTALDHPRLRSASVKDFVA